MKKLILIALAIIILSGCSYQLVNKDKEEDKNAVKLPYQTVTVGEFYCETFSLSGKKTCLICRPNKVISIKNGVDLECYNNDELTQPNVSNK